MRLAARKPGGARSAPVAILAVASATAASNSETRAESARLDHHLGRSDGISRGCEANERSA